MGVPAHPKPPVDLACPNLLGGELYIEVEGTTGAVSIHKGRQLGSYIDDADDPASMTGAIIGNPFRMEHPSNRPPPGSQVGLFSPPLERMAARDSWPLLTTTQLFEWVRRHLDGDNTGSVELRQALGLA